MISKQIFSNARRLGRRFAAVLLVLFAVPLLMMVPFGTSAQEPLEPDTLPDAGSGLALYDARCANCHGPSGQGDGELAGNLPAPPRDFSDEAFRRTAVPSSHFQTITDGRLEGAMPPFGPASSNPIDEESRWDLVAAVISLGTPAEAVERGQVVYEENCLTCHGEDGKGDGPEAADSSSTVIDLSDLRYWYNRSNEMVLASLEGNSISDHTYELEQDQLWDVIDYARTFSYVTGGAKMVVAAPISTVTVAGQVSNGTTGEIIKEGTVLLRAFTPELQEALSLTTGVDSDGNYAFEVEDASADWVYMSSYDYADLSFSSNPAQADSSDPILDMPIVAFETTTDPSAININQVHWLMDFVEDRVEVSEIYVLSNLEPAVFMGESGVPEEGTLRLALPDGAENINFQRSFRSFENFLPATEIISLDDGLYADTVPIRPGDGAMNLFISYELPYESGMTIEHPVFYETDNSTIVMPDIGLEVTGEGWTTQGSQEMGELGSIISYARENGLQAGDIVRFSIEGEPTAPASTVGATVSAENEPLAIVVAGAVLLLVAGGATYTVQRWRSTAEEETIRQEDEVDHLLNAVAALDDAYEAGNVDEATYDQRRTKLLNELAARWPQYGANHGNT